MGCINDKNFPPDTEGVDINDVRGSSDLGGDGGKSDWVPDREMRTRQKAARRAEFAAAEGEANGERKSVRDVLRKRLLNEVIRACRPGGLGEPDECFVLVLDGTGSRILGSVLKMYDIMFPQEGVALVDSLGVKRQPAPALEAVYFVEPTEENVATIMDDFDSNKKDPMYSGIHLLFTGPISKTCMDAIRESPRLLKHIISLEEMNVDFSTVEDRTVLLDIPDSMVTMYGRDIPHDIQAQTITTIAERLHALCATLGEVPFIRYENGNGLCAAVSEKLVQCVRAKMALPSFKMQETPRATLLLVGRAEDLYAPLLHEFTYQAMTFEHLEVTDKYQWSWQNADGSKETFQLNDQGDNVWISNRHKHIASVSGNLDLMKKELTSSEALIIQRKIEQKDANLSLQEMQEYMRLKEEADAKVLQYMHHTRLATTLTNLCDDTLFDVNELEAQIVSGVGFDTNSGSILTITDSALLTNLLARLGQVEVTLTDKLRLIALYILQAGGISHEIKEKIVSACEPPLPADLFHSLASYSYMGVTMIDHGLDKAKAAERKRIRSSLQKAAKQQVRESELLTRTLTPKLKETLQKHIDEKLTMADYMWRDPLLSRNLPETTDKDWYDKAKAALGGIEGGASKFRTMKTSRSMRSHKALLGKAKKTRGGLHLRGPSVLPNVGSRMSKLSSLEASSLQAKFEGPRVIVCVLGGMTYSEIRSIYELMAVPSQNREIIAVSTEAITPKIFLDQLRRLNPDNRI